MSDMQAKVSVEDVLKNPKFPPEWPYSANDFKRMDESDDEVPCCTHTRRQKLGARTYVLNTHTRTHAHTHTHIKIIHQDGSRVAHVAAMRSVCARGMRRCIIMSLRLRTTAGGHAHCLAGVLRAAEAGDAHRRHGHQRSHRVLRQGDCAQEVSAPPHSPARVRGCDMIVHVHTRTPTHTHTHLPTHQPPVHLPARSTAHLSAHAPPPRVTRTLRCAATYWTNWTFAAAG